MEAIAGIIGRTTLAVKMRLQSAAGCSRKRIKGSIFDMDKGSRRAERCH